MKIILFERLWCLYEISQARKNNIMIQLLINIPNEAVSEIIKNFENAKCAEKNDEKEIRKLIIELFGNYSNFCVFLNDKKLFKYLIPPLPQVLYDLTQNKNYKNKYQDLNLLFEEYDLKFLK